MINYINTISNFHPGIEVSSSDATNYNAIDWNGNTPISQAQLDAEWLELYKSDYIVAMSALAEADIVGGFQSDALGGSPNVYTYDSEHEDQLNLIGSATAGDDMYYAVRVNGVKSYVWHTHEQLKLVVQDGRDVKLGILQTFNTKKAAILAATTKEEVDAITWG